MGVDLYYMPMSAPCRSVLLLAKSIGLELNPKVVDLMAGETRTPEFIKVRTLPITMAIFIFPFIYLPFYSFGY